MFCCFFPSTSMFASLSSLEKVDPKGSLQNSVSWQMDLYTPKHLGCFFVANEGLWVYPYHPWDWSIYLHLIDFDGKCR